MSLIDSSLDSNPSTPCLSIDHPKSVFFNIGKRAIDRENCSNIFKSYRPDQKMKLSVSKLTEEQVLSSQTYKQLLSKFKWLSEEAHSDDPFSFKKSIATIEEKIKATKEATHRHKYEVWELRNEVLSLEQEIGDEINQYNYLHECLMGGNDNDESESQDFDNPDKNENDDDAEGPNDAGDDQQEPEACEDDGQAEGEPYLECGFGNEDSKCRIKFNQALIGKKFFEEEGPVDDGSGEEDHSDELDSRWVRCSQF